MFSDHISDTLLTGFQRLRVDRSPDQTPAAVSGTSEGAAREPPGLGAVRARPKRFPRPPEPLGHVGVGGRDVVVSVVVVVVDAGPPEAHGHVDVAVRGLQGGRVEPDDGREADSAAGGAHLDIKALHVQTPEDVTLNLNWEIATIMSDFPDKITVTDSLSL